MRQFEQAVEAACATEAIPGAVLVATDRAGKWNYARAFGKRSVRAGADQAALDLDAVMWIASCTKVITSIAAMQCVERGQLTLDGPIYDVLPELKQLTVIKEIGEDGQPNEALHQKMITLRHLLNHSSGLAYDETHPLLLGWHAWHRTKPNRNNTVESRFHYPLVFEPGEGWFYGPGIDWAGVAVERVSGGLPLQRYFEKYIFEPTGAEDIVFSSYLHEREDLVARKADMSKRDPERPAKVKRSNAKLQFNERGGCFGGLGLFASAPAYLKDLQGLLTTDVNQKLLTKEAVEEFFRPCLSEKAKADLNELLTVEEARQGMGNLSRSVTKNWALGGIVNEQDNPYGRAAGSMTWGGLPNLVWFVDRTAGVCALYATQVVPPADPKSMELAAAFELAIYEMLPAKVKL